MGQLLITADKNQSEKQIKEKGTSKTTIKSKLKWKSPPELHQLLTDPKLRVVIISPLLHQAAIDYNVVI